jgi:hypothetical protein
MGNLSEDTRSEGRTRSTQERCPLDLDVQFFAAPHHKSVGGVEVYVHHAISALEVSGQLHAPAGLPQDKDPLATRLSGPQNQSGRCGGKNLLPLPAIEPRPSSPSLCRLSYPGSLLYN